MDAGMIPLSTIACESSDVLLTAASSRACKSLLRKNKGLLDFITCTVKDVAT